MSQQDSIILALSLISIISISYLPIFSAWRKTIGKYKIESFLVFGLFIGVFFLGGERAEGTTGLVDTRRMIRIALYLLIAASSLLILLKTKIRTWHFGTGLTFMTIYAIYGMFSAVYSVDTLLTLWKAFEVLTHVLVAAIIVTRMNTIENALNLTGIFWLTIIFILCSLLWGILVSPDEAFRPFLDNTGAVASHGTFGSGLRGSFPKLHLNSVTQVGAIVSMLSIVMLSSTNITASKKPLLILFIFGISVTILGHSRTSIFALAIALLVIAYYLKNRRLRFFIIATGTVIGITAIASGLITEYILRGQTEEQFSSLTGRLDFWDVVIKAIMEQPIIGYGFYSGTRILFGLPGVDNTYLNVLMGGGFILFIIFIIPIFRIIHDLYFTRPSLRHVDKSGAYRSLWAQTSGLFILLFLRSLSGPSFDANHFNLILFLLCINNANTLYHFRRDVPNKNIEEEHAPPAFEKDNILARKKQRNLINKS